MKKLWSVLAGVGFLFPANGFCEGMSRIVVSDASIELTDCVDSPSDVESLTPVADAEPPDEGSPFLDDPPDPSDTSDLVSDLEETGGYTDHRCGNLLARAYASIEYQHWYTKGRSLPPLVTGGNPAATLFSDAGVLPAAPILFGGRDVEHDLKAGGRITGGLWFNDSETAGAVVRFYGSEGDSTRFGANSMGNPILGVPFNDRSAALFGLENAFVLAYSGGLTPGIDAQGGVSVHAANDIWGGDLFFRKMLNTNCDFRLDLLAGYQFTRIDDDLTVDTNLTRFDIAGTPQFLTNDLFDVSNEFHGGQIGLMSECSHGPLTVQLMGKIGVGNMNQAVTIAGSNTVISGGSVTSPGGIFAQTTPTTGGPAFNMGSYERNVLVWSPEASVKLSYELSERISVSIGYTFLYWTRVALAGDQVDRRVNRDVMFGGPFLPGGGANPAFSFNDTDFWVQTIDIGLACTY